MAVFSGWRAVVLGLVCALVGAYDDFVMPVAPQRYRMLTKLSFAQAREVSKQTNMTLYEEVWTDRDTRRARTIIKAGALLMDEPDSEELMYVV